MPPLDRHKTVRESLKYVSENPGWPKRAVLDMEVWEIVSRNLYDIANSPDTRVIGSMAKATRAQRIILNRTTGTRRTGSNPAVGSNKQIRFVDLTIPKEPEEPDSVD